MKAYKELISRTFYKYAFKTFNVSSQLQEFTVPNGTTKISVDCVGSSGYPTASPGGDGGRVQCTLKVTPGDILYIMVGGVPESATVAEYNASDIRTDGTGVLDNTSLSSRLVVAGGGGSSTRTDASAGYGGGLIGGDAQVANANYGNGGTQSAGGASGGSFGLGGSNNVQTYATGGAGWYGGGSGVRTSNSHINGGGGSSYTDPDLCYYVKHTQGYQDGEGYVKFTYAVLATAEDYDYYVDVARYKVVSSSHSSGNLYYAINSYKEGSYVNPITLVRTFIVGTPTIENGIASGFSLSKYIQTYKPFAPESYPWEMQVKFKPTFTSNNRRGCLWNDAYGDYRFPKQEITTVSNSSLKIGIRITSSGGSWTIERGQNDATISYDYTKWVYLKTQFTGTAYITSYKLEGDADFTVMSSVSSTAAIWQPTDALGVTIGADISSGGSWVSYFDGQIDLNETYIKCNSVYWFNGSMLNGVYTI